MPLRMENPKLRFIRTIKARRNDESFAEINEYVVSGNDPTATGTIWQNRMSFTTHRLSSGEPVELNDDGTAVVSHTGEILTIA